MRSQALAIRSDTVSGPFWRPQGHVLVLAIRTPTPAIGAQCTPHSIHLIMQRHAGILSALPFGMQSLACRVAPPC